MIVYKQGLNTFNPQKSVFTTPDSSTKLSASESKVLQYLIEHKGEIVTRDKLLDIGWPDKVVVPNSLNVAIANLRKAFRCNQDIIITIKGTGFTIALDTFTTSLNEAPHSMASSLLESINNHGIQNLSSSPVSTEDIQTEKNTKDAVRLNEKDNPYLQSLSKKALWILFFIITSLWIILWCSSWQKPPCISVDGQEICGNIGLLNLEKRPHMDSHYTLFIDMQGHMYEKN